MLERSEIDSKYKWDLTKIYKDDNAFLSEYAKAERAVKGFSVHEKTM